MQHLIALNRILINNCFYEEDNYYNQFDDCVLDEIIVKTVTDEEGNTISEITTEIAGDEKEVSETIKEYDIFGNVVEQSETVQASENGKGKNKSEVVTSYEYDYQGNITQTTTKSRKDVNESWVITTTKSTFDDQGQMIASYDARGVKEGYATKYEYDLSGQQVKEHIPVEKKDGVIIYQTYSKEYDEDGNVIAEENKQNDSDVQRTEYVYDIMGRLIQVKDIVDNEKAIYAQYLYDCEGNKIRQYTGLTHPLSITLKEGKGDNGYTYMGKEYHVEVLDKEKRNTYSETKYEYDKGNQLISYTDSEGNEENYTYDVYGNLIKTVDKNGNTIIQTYDYQNRLKKQEATERETKKKTIHKYVYDDNGNMSKIDNRRFLYGKIHGQITSEKWDIGKKTLEKEYLYDSDGTAINFGIKVDGQTELSYNYEYDGESKLKKVVQTDGNRDEAVAAYEYDANGILVKENNTKTDTVYEYNLNGRVSRMENKKSDGVLLSEYSASYAINGQKTKETEEVRTSGGMLQKKTSQYTYDLLGRLTKESTQEKRIFFTLMMRIIIGKR